MNILVLAPMAGFTHSPFRRLVRRCGADWTWSELISARMILKQGLGHNFLCFTPEERPLRIQLHGADPEDIYQAAEMVLKGLRPDGIDLNAGCPAPKVVRTGAGAALLKDLDRLYHVACALEEAAKAYGVEASVKFRLGFSEDQLEKIAEVLLRAGIKVLVLHARLAREGFSGQARWNRIRDLVQLVGQQAKVIGNGDVKSYIDIEKMFVQTRCHGVMVGRAALVRPWIFREYRQGRSLDLSLADRISLLDALWQDLEAQRGPEGAFKALKVLVPKILKGVPGKRALLTRLLEVKDPDLFWRFLKGFQDAGGDTQTSRSIKTQTSPLCLSAEPRLVS